MTKSTLLGASGGGEKHRPQKHWGPHSQCQVKLGFGGGGECVVVRSVGHRPTQPSVGRAYLAGWLLRV